MKALVCLFVLLVCTLAGCSQSQVDQRIGEHHAQAPPAIRTSGVPHIEPALFDDLRPLANIRSASLEGWSPDGQSIFISTRLGNLYQIHRVDQPGGARQQITFTSDNVRYALPLRFSKGKRIVYSMATGGDENYQAYLLNIATGKTNRLTDGESRNSVGPHRHHDEMLLISSNRRNGRDTDTYLVDPDKPDDWRMLMQVDQQFWAAADWSPDDSKLLMVRYVSANENHPHVFDPSTGKLTPLPIPDDAPEQVSWDSLRWSPDGLAVYGANDMAGEFTHLVRIDLANGKYTWLTKDIPWDVSGVEVSPRGDQLAFVTNEDGYSSLYLLSLPDHQRSKIDLPVGRISGLEFSPDGTKLAFNYSTDAHPTDVFVYTLADKQLTRWTYSETGGLASDKPSNQKLFRYRSFDGRMIPAFIRTPSGPGPHPVIISIHGGPESQYRPSYGGAGQYWADELGVAIIAPNVRGSSGYGKTYLKLDNGFNREDSVKDIGALLDWIAQQPNLDASRVGVTGGSYGGYMVLASLVHYSDRIKAGIDSVGISNFVTFLERTKAYRRDLRRVEYGDERDPKMRAHLEKISPANNADKINASLLVIHGLNDPRVPIEEARQIVHAVRKNGQTVWSVVADDEGHGFAKKANAEFSMAVITTFWKQHLLPRE